MILAEGDTPFMRKYLTCLRKTYTAKNNEEMKEATDWLQANYGHHQMEQAIKSILTGSAQFAIQQALCKLLQAHWNNNKDRLFGLAFFKEQGMKTKVARLFAQALSKLVTVLPYEEKKSLVCQTVHTIINERELGIVQNLLILLQSVIESVTNHNILDIYNSQYGNILSITVATMGSIDNQLKVVSGMAEQFDQRQLNKLQQLQQILGDTLELTVKILEKANEEEHTYYMILEQMNNSTHFRQVMEQGIRLNVPGANSIVLISDLKQTESFNEFKSVLMRIANEVFPLPMGSLLDIVMSTLLAGDNQTTDTAVRCIFAECLCMLSRWLEDQRTYSYFHDKMIDIFYCMFKFSVSNSQEVSLMTEKPEVFNEMGRECCEGESMMLDPKEKAVKFLNEMCTKIDGTFCRTAQTLLIILDSCLVTIAQSHQKYRHFLKEFQAYGINRFNEIQKVETCLLLMASLTNHFINRPDLKAVTVQLIEHRLDQIMNLGPLVTNRLIIFINFNPFLRFLNLFPVLIKTNETNMLQVTWAIEALLKKKLKKEFQDVVIQIVTEIIIKISCLDRLFHIVVQNNFEQIANVETIKIIIQRIVTEISINFSHKPAQLVSHVSTLCNLLIHVISKVKQPTTYDNYVNQALNHLGQHKMCDDSLIDLAVSYVDRAQHITPFQSQFIRRIGSVSSPMVELYNRHLLYSQELGWLSNQIAVFIQQTFEEAELWQLAVLAELAVYQSKTVQSIACILQAIQNKLLMETDNKILYHRMLLVFVCLYSKYRQATQFLSQALDSQKYLQTKLCKKTYCIHMMNITLHEAQNPNKLTEIVDIISHLVLKLCMLEKSVMDVEAPYEADSIKVFARLVSKNFKHPVMDLDLLEAFRQMWENLVRLRNDVADIVDKQAVKTILHNRMVGNKPRVVMKLKR